MDSKEKINILDAIIVCDYQINTRDYIISVFYDFFMDKNPSMYITWKLNKKTQEFEQILVVRIIIKVSLHMRFYDVPVLIYLPKMFPGEAPEIYVEGNEGIGVNNRCLIVDKNSMKVTVSSIINWNSSKSLISNVVKEITDEFTKIFPVYKLDVNNVGKIILGEECRILSQNAQIVSFDAPSKQEKIIPLNHQNNLNFQNVHHNLDRMNIQNNESRPLIDLNFKNNSIDKSKQSNKFTVDQIKNIYVNELIAILIPKIIKERKKLQNDSNNLMNYKRMFSLQVDHTKALAERKDEIISKIKNLSSNVHEEMVIYKNYIEVNTPMFIKFNQLENAEKLIKISDINLLKVIAKEAVLEDFLFYIKKAYEKKIITFPETIKKIRIYSRDLFTLKSYRDKLIKNYK